MNTLYIHGLYSKPRENKLKILKSFNLNPFAEHVDYEQTPTAYQLLKGIIKDRDIEFIVGSSYGGYLGFWLAEELSLPCLLFNPAIVYAPKPEMIMPDVKSGQCPIRLVVQGKKDNIVDPDANYAFLKNNTKESQKQKILCLDWVEHTIDLVTFEISIHWAVETLTKRNF